MINIPKGTKDVLLSDSFKWQKIEALARELAGLYGFKEIRTPTFEHTELFLRGVGDTTDIVNKEMYTFLDKGGRSITLRPEGTAGVARAYIENGDLQASLPMKAYYLAAVFRYERPQNGRLREHHQFGVEMYGSDSPYADAEVISLANTFLRKAGLSSLQLNINSIGCEKCRKAYNEALRDYIGKNLDNMCGQCRDRFERNPLRILDCKEEGCKRITQGAPSVLDYLCDDCKAHFEELLGILDDLGIAYVVNPMLVRGLDYYTRTVFEFVSTDIGAQGTVCGGGRYNNLLEQIGGKHTPAVGFGLGIERLLLVLENTGATIVEDKSENTFYFATMGGEAQKFARKAVMQFREAGLRAETDCMGKSLKAQMKYADKNGFGWVIVIGDDELSSGFVKAKRLENGEEHVWQIKDILPLSIEKLDGIRL